MVFYLLLLVYCFLPAQLAAWDQQPDGYELIDAPSNSSSLAQWRSDWGTWRRMEHQTNRYNPNDTCTVYNIPSTQWTQVNFVQAFLMMTDRSIYDRETQQYTVSKYVEEMQARVGKLDSVLLWTGYPNGGVDSRNQWDQMSSLPGGLDGLKQVIAEFHSYDIRCVIPYNPWDTGTDDVEGQEDMVRTYTADIQTLTQLIPELQADGFNGDTMYGVPRSFYNCTNPLVGMPEGGVPPAYIGINPASWGYLYGFSHWPPVAKAKFLESRHMVQVCARWSMDKTGELLIAFFNGAGYVVWENVWGILNANTAREDETIKRMFAILRNFGHIVSTGQWTPYYGLKDDGLFASAFDLQANGETLYTVVSSLEEEATFELELTDQEASDNVIIYDAYRGVELTKQSASSSDGMVVRVTIEPRAFGAIYVTTANGVNSDLNRYLTQMQAMTSSPLSSYSTTRDLLQQELVNYTAADVVSETNPDEMVRVTGASDWLYNVTGVQIEPVHAWTPNFAQFGTGVQFPWEDRPWNNHSMLMTIPDFFMDKYPVTNAQYEEFLVSSGYTPNTLDRFLLHWNNRTGSPASWSIPSGLEQSPVVYIAREDAEAYAAFYGKTLPHDWQMQYVASNGDNYDPYPWGSEYDRSILPEVSYGKEAPTLDPVGSYQQSRSTRFLVEDIAGYVWQMTDQFCDVHTCGFLVRGGSCYHPIPSTGADPNWYFPQALHAQQHNRFLMISEGYDRSALVGFRCVKSIP